MASPDSASLDGLQQIVDRLAATLGRSVAIDDAQGRLVVASGHFGEEDALRIYAIVHRYSDPRVMAHFRAHGIYSWTRPGRVPQSEELQFKARVCCPIRDHDILFGHLFLIDEGVSDDDIRDAAAVAVQIGQLMYRRLTLHESAQRGAEIVVRELISPDPRTQRRAARAAVDDGLLSVVDPIVAVLVRVVAPAVETGSDAVQTDLHTAVELTTRDRLRGQALAWIRAGEALVLLTGRAVEQSREVAGQLVAQLRTSGHRAVAGIGPVGRQESAAATSFADAALAARAAELLPDLGTVLTAEDLGVYRLLLKLPADELTADRYPPELRRLLADDSADTLLPTLALYLDCGGDAGRTVASLHVHRSTLYYRLGRIEAITQVDLRDGNNRLSLQLGLALRRLVEALPRHLP